MAQNIAPRRLSAILVGKDDGTDAIAGYLGRQNIDITVVADGRELDRAFEAKQFDLMLLDLVQSGEDGLSICQRIRKESPIPIIATSSCQNNIDKIVSLELGADDYIPKPLDPREILARIRALNRRVELSARLKRELGAVYLFADWRLDSRSRKLVSPEGRHVSITGAEYGVLKALCENPGQVLSRNRLIELTHGQIDSPSERSVDIIVSRLRHKLEAHPALPKIIRTIRFEGYIFASRVERLPNA